MIDLLKNVSSDNLGFAIIFFGAFLCSFRFFKTYGGAEPVEDQRPTIVKIGIAIIVIGVVVQLILMLYNRSEPTVNKKTEPTALPLTEPKEETPPKLIEKIHTKSLIYNIEFDKFIPTNPTPETPRVFELSNEDLIVIKDAVGVAVIQVETLEECQGSYKWRYSPSQKPEVYAGEGEIYEQYVQSPSNDQNTSHVSVVDALGKREIKAGPYWIGWSCSGEGSGHYYPNGVKTYILKNKNLEDFRF